MTIHIATDHAGFEIKESIKTWLIASGHTVIDHGAFSYDTDDDYPDFVIPCAEAVANDLSSLGIIFGGSGQGEAFAANKIAGIRAGVYYGGNLEIVKLLKEHNNANILSLGARFLSLEYAQEAITLFLETNFSGDERHVRRINKIEQ